MHVETEAQEEESVCSRSQGHLVAQIPWGVRQAWSLDSGALSEYLPHHVMLSRYLWEHAGLAVREGFLKEETPRGSLKDESQRGGYGAGEASRGPCFCPLSPAFFSASLGVLAPSETYTLPMTSSSWEPRLVPAFPSGPSTGSTGTQIVTEPTGQGPKNPRVSSVTVQLEMKALWEEFNQLGTEMIVTKAGRCVQRWGVCVVGNGARWAALRPLGVSSCRRMFPTFQVKILGMDSRADYALLMDFVPLDDKRYRCGGPAGEVLRAQPEQPRQEARPGAAGGSPAQGSQQSLVGSGQPGRAEGDRAWAGMETVTAPAPCQLGSLTASLCSPGTPSTARPGWWRARRTRPHPAVSTSTLTRRPRARSGCARSCPSTSSS